MLPSMIDIFKTLFGMSVSSVWIILAVIVLRLVLRRVPKQARVLMWVLPAARLTVPFSFESRFSVTPELTRAMPSVSESAVNLVTTTDLVYAAIWLTVTAGMFLYMLLSFLRLKIRVRENLILRDNIYICDKISSPFVLGVFRPKIYVPSDLSGRQLDYVLLHERAHIKRLDTLCKPAAFLILSLHWFNPLVWAAYVLFTRDIELACDERAVRLLPFSERKNYSIALLECCTKNYFTAACPFAFGEKPVKQRIKSILSYKKPKAVHKIAAVVCCAVASLLFLTNPVTAKVARQGNHIVNLSKTGLLFVPLSTEPAEEKATEPPTEAPEQVETQAPDGESAEEEGESYYEPEEYVYYKSEAAESSETEEYYYADDSESSNYSSAEQEDFESYIFPYEEYVHHYDWAAELRSDGFFGSTQNNSWDPFTDSNGRSVFQWDYTPNYSR